MDDAYIWGGSLEKLAWAGTAGADDARGLRGDIGSSQAFPFRAGGDRGRHQPAWVWMGGPPVCALLCEWAIAG